MQQNIKVFQENLYQDGHKEVIKSQQIESQEENSRFEEKSTVLNKNKDKADLDISKSQKWNFQERKSLFLLYNKHGSCWSLLHQSIPSKNKIQIRNKFYGTIRNILRCLMVYFKTNSGDLTSISNKIKPILLQKLYESDQEFEFTSGTIKKMIQDMNYGVEKQKLQLFISKNPDFFRKIINTILQKKVPKRVSYRSRISEYGKSSQKEVAALKEQIPQQQIEENIQAYSPVPLDLMNNYQFYKNQSISAGNQSLLQESRYIPVVFCYFPQPCANYLNFHF